MVEDPLGAPVRSETPPLDVATLDPPAGFRAVLDTLEDAGYEAWAVGGALRDAVEADLVSREVRQLSDWDVSTNARPEEVMHLFRRTVPLGVEHGTVGVLHEDGVVYETTTFRRDIETDGRHATVQFAETIEEDLARRDFTINAMAWRPRTGQVRDPFGGRRDLEDGILRAVGEPAARFSEDYLRVLRALRFAGRFDLEIEPETREAIDEAVARLSVLSAERVREELMKVLDARTPSTALDLYAECGALDHWYPELASLASDRNRWRSHLGTVDAIPFHRPLVRLARLLVPLSDDPEVREEVANGLLTRLRFSNADRRRVARLVRSHLPFPSPLDSSAQLRSWLADVGDAWRDLFRLHIGGARDSGDEQWQRVVAAAFRGVHAEVLAHPPLETADLAIDGDDLLGLGLAPGPLVGLLLDELLEQVLEDPDRNDAGVLLAEAGRLIEIGALTGPRVEDPDGGETEPPEAGGRG